MKRHFESSLEQSFNHLDVILRPFYQSLDIEDRIFVKLLLRPFPREMQKVMISCYENFDCPFKANSFLRETCNKIDSLVGAKLLPYLDASEDGLRDLADDQALRCKRIGLMSFKKIPLTGLDPVNGNSEVFKLCAEVVNGFGLPIPKISKSVTLTGAVKRMQDNTWWLHKLRKAVNRTLEKILIHLKQVNSKKGKYCSDLTLKRRRAQKANQLRLLDSLLLVNENEQVYSLKEISEKNVSNPTNRRHELMTRMAGFEKLSKQAKHDAAFITLTCPSKYHNSYALSGDRNPNWNGATPYDGQQYLNLVWSRIRAEFERNQIKVYGFRTCEPQHDGTPHWHLLLFLKPSDLDTLTSIIMHYSLQEDGEERGAKENRLDIKHIDQKKGSATGYIAKYISKNTDAEGLDCDLDGDDASISAARIEAWARCWGIRQFQQIGAGSVTVWRELRRLSDLECQDQKLAEIHCAADEGDWAGFVASMGGVFCIRAEQAIRPFYAEIFNKVTGQIKQSWFDGLITKKLKGIVHKGREIITRIHEWHLIHRSEKAEAAFPPLLGVL